MFTSGKLMALEELKSSCAMATRAAPAQAIRMSENTFSSTNNLRELQPCHFMVKGILLIDSSEREIARKLNLSEITVRNYVFRIFEKLGTSNRVELALYSVRQQM
jgi:DNA-binding NarL/FixJ family response regulator